MVDDKKLIRVEGLVIESLPGLLFKVKLNDEKEILAHLSGKMKLNRIKVLPGDKVIIEVYSLEDKRGRIVKRI